MKEVYKSRVYTDRPAYADFDAPSKFEAIKSIIAKRLREHPNAICSYSGGSDSDILLHLIENVRETFGLPPIKYAFFNTGLEMEATKRHVREMESLYGVKITSYRPKINIVQATRKYGLPFVSKIMSAGLEGVQNKNIPLSIHDEYIMQRIRRQNAGNSENASQDVNQQLTFYAAATLKESPDRTYNL